MTQEVPTGAQSGCGAGASGAPASAAPGVPPGNFSVSPAASLDAAPAEASGGTVGSDPQMAGAEMCYLCYSVIQTTKVSPGCEHPFHVECWSRYLRSASTTVCPVTTCPRYAAPTDSVPASLCTRCGRLSSPTWEQESLAWADCRSHLYHYECLQANIEEDGQECPICGPRPATPPPPLTPPPRPGDGEENPWAGMSDEVTVRTHPPGWHSVRHFW